MQHADWLLAMAGWQTCNLQLGVIVSPFIWHQRKLIYQKQVWCKMLQLNHATRATKKRVWRSLKVTFLTLWPWPLTYDLDLHTWPRYHLCSSLGQIWWLYVKWFQSYEFLSSDFLSSLNFGPVTDIQTESDAYEPTVHMHRCAQK